MVDDALAVHRDKYPDVAVRQLVRYGRSAAVLVAESAGAALTVVAVEATSAGSVWVLERASDGARASVRLGARAAEGLSVAAGTAVVVTAISTGWVLSAASRAIAFVPNEIGAALLYNERVTR